MRIIAGTAKGHTLKVPKDGVRPTSERVRESIFNRLNSEGITWSSTCVLDLFAGSGAFALEALSRGAKFATAVDQSRSSVSVIRENSVKTKLDVNIIQSDAFNLVPARLPDQYDLVFIDPPYEVANEDITQLIVRLKSNEILKDHGTCIIERSSKTLDLDVPDAFRIVDARNHGDTRLIWLIW